MTFYEWIRQCLLWDAERKALPPAQKTAMLSSVAARRREDAGGPEREFQKKPVGNKTKCSGAVSCCMKTKEKNDPFLQN